MPRARVSTATAVKPGYFPSMRAAYRRSCQMVSISSPPDYSAGKSTLFTAQRGQRIDTRSAARRQIRRQGRNSRKQERQTNKRKWIRGRHAKQNGGKRARQGKSNGQPNRQADDGEKHAPSQHQDRKSTRLNSSHRCISYAVFCLKKKI